MLGKLVSLNGLNYNLTEATTFIVFLYASCGLISTVIGFFIFTNGTKFNSFNNKMQGC